MNSKKDIEKMMKMSISKSTFYSFNYGALSLCDIMCKDIKLLFLIKNCWGSLFNIYFFFVMKGTNINERVCGQYMG